MNEQQIKFQNLELKDYCKNVTFDIGVMIGRNINKDGICHDIPAFIEKLERYFFELIRDKKSFIIRLTTVMKMKIGVFNFGMTLRKEKLSIVSQHVKVHKQEIILYNCYKNNSNGGIVYEVRN